MIDFIFHFLFIFFTIFILLKSIFYAFYEINTEKNKTGGIAIIALSIIATIFSNIIIVFY